MDAATSIEALSLRDQDRAADRMGASEVVRRIWDLLNPTFDDHITCLQEPNKGSRRPPVPDVQFQPVIEREKLPFSRSCSSKASET